jgi:hypothetical protein
MVLSHFTSALVTHVDTLIRVKRNSLATFEHCNLDWRNVLTRTPNDPTVTSPSVSVLLLMVLSGLQKQGFLLGKYLNGLHSAVLQLLTRLQEEGDLALDEHLATPSILLLSIRVGIDNDTVLSA